jgi:methylated-DNA-[protein]-cysteine S-methyltransferase
MIKSCTYASPLGLIHLAAAPEGLCGLYFEAQKHWPADSHTWQQQQNAACFTPAKLWLDAYFAGESASLPPLHFDRGTPFQQTVWKALLGICFGQTCTYGALAQRLLYPQASRAIGAAVGRNPISLMIPCHRVLGAAGALTGYAGGLERKKWLLEHEQKLGTGPHPPALCLKCS